jgi:hypothetical protein
MDPIPTRPKVRPLPSPSYATNDPPQLPQSKSLLYIDNDLNKSSRPSSPTNADSDESRTPGRQDSSTPDANKPAGGINVPAGKKPQHPGERLSFNAHAMGSAVSDSFADDHYRPQSAPRTPIGTPSGMQSPISYASSPRRNPHTGTIYNGISAGVVPVENLTGAAASPRGGPPSPQSLHGQHGMTPGAVGLAGVAPRGTQGSVVPQSPGLVPEVNAEAEEYYGGKEVWSRSRTYSNVSEEWVRVGGVCGADALI